MFDREKGKEIATEEEPLLFSNPTDDLADEEAPPAPLKAEKEVILSVRREPFLLEETLACIQILKDLQPAAALKTKHANKTHYGLTLLGAILVLGTFGEAGIMLGLIFAVSAMLNDRLLPKLEHQLDSLLNQFNLNNSILEQEKIKAKNTQTSYDSVNKTIHSMLEYLRNQRDKLYDQWTEGYYQQLPNCRWWLKEDGTEDSVNNYYHGSYGASGSAEWCWMPRHGVTHPIARCNDVMNEICSSWMKEDALEAQLEPYKNALNAAQRAVSATESTLDSLQEKITRINYQIDHPGFEFEPITLTLFIILSVASLALLLGGGYAYWRSHKNNQVARAHNDNVETAITNPNTAERIINLTSRLGINDLRGMKLQTLIDQLTIKANELQLRRKQMMAFFFGGLPSNPNATNRQFLNKDSAGDMIGIIYDYAFPKPGV